MANTDYATTDALKPRISAAAGDTTDEALLQQLLNTCAYLVDVTYLGRLPPQDSASAGPSPLFSATAAGVTRVYDDPGTGIVTIDPCLIITAVVRNGSAVQTTQYQARPLRRWPIREIWLRQDAAPLQYNDPARWYGYPLRDVGAGQVSVTGTWGASTAATRPAVVAEATLMLAERFYERLGLSPQKLLDAQQNPYKYLDPLITDLIGTLRADGRSIFA